MNSNIKFYQNRIITTAMEEGHKYDGIALIIKRYPWVNEDWLFAQKKLLEDDKIIATVRCHKSDFYDAAAGRTAALRKLNRIIVRHREAVVKRFEGYVKDYMEKPAAKKMV